MNIERRRIADAVGTIVMRNVAGADGRRVLKKGTFLTEEHVQNLAGLERLAIDVGVLVADDVREDEAALAIGGALQTEELRLSSPAGGRVNLQTKVDGLLEVEAARLLELNLLAGITLATRRQHTIVGPSHETDNVATLKIIPLAIERRFLDQALALCQTQPRIITIRPFTAGRRVAMLLVGEPSVHEKLHLAYVPPTRTRLERLGAELVTEEAVGENEADIAAAAGRLANLSDLLIIAGQTSIMDQEDTTLRALRQAGADLTLTGAPVEPGNLLALAYLPGTPVLCAPGCARGLRRNIVDLVLPRLLLGDRLGPQEIAELGLGGFLTRAERAGDST